MWNPLRNLRNLFTRTTTRVVNRTVRAHYDNAQTGPGNAKHWADADELGPISSNTYAVRATLRKRARLERDNNPHLNALVKTWGHNFIGTGPRLQLQLGESGYESGRLVEQSFAAWAKSIDLAEKLRLMAEVRPIDGAAFGIMFDNPATPNPIKMDIRVLEDEQVTTPELQYQFNSTAVDGMELDAYGNPTFYHVLKEHPGDGIAWGGMGDYDRVPAKFVLHWFRPSRPGQMRGVCELASSIGVGAQSRRYSAAVLTKAEVAANIAGVMETDTPADNGDAITTEIMEEIDFPRGALLTLPGGYKAKTFDNGNTTTGFGEYLAVQHSTLGRPLLMPRNLVTGDSSDFNFASGKIDQLPFYQSIWIERNRLAARVLDPLFKAWYVEARGVGLIPEDLPALNEWVWDWHWDGFASIDPVKDATAIEKRMALNLTTLSEECAADGKNWRDVIDQKAIERAYMRSKGIDPDAGMNPAAPPPQEAADPAQVQQDEGANV